MWFLVSKSTTFPYLRLTLLSGCSYKPYSWISERLPTEFIDYKTRSYVRCIGKVLWDPTCSRDVCSGNTAGHPSSNPSCPSCKNLTSAYETNELECPLEWRRQASKSLIQQGSVQWYRQMQDLGRIQRQLVHWFGSVAQFDGLEKNQRCGCTSGVTAKHNTMRSHIIWPKELDNTRDPVVQG